MVKRLAVSVSMVMALSLGVLHCAYPATYDDIKKKDFYTKVNIWYESYNIPSTNYHLGTMIPAGTRVKIGNINNDLSSPEISFYVDGQGKSFTIAVRVGVTNLPIEKIFWRYFSEKNPLMEGGMFSKFTTEEQERIKKGVIKEGMSKDAVIMAYGYPPTHKTPTLESNTWLYWKALKRIVAVKFKDGKVSEIKRGNSATLRYDNNDDED